MHDIINMETFCTSGPHSKYRAALTSSSFYQPSPYSRNLRQNDYNLQSRNHHSTLLWHQRTRHTNNSKPRSKLCSIVLAVAAFIVLVAVLAIAGLALYMGALRSEAPIQLLTFTCSARVLRGDRFISHFQEKSIKYKQQLENLYRKSTLGSSIVSIVVDRFGEDTFTIFFRISLDRKKLSRSISNLEKALKDILLNDSLSRRPIFRNVRFDPRSVQIRQMVENDHSYQKAKTRIKDTFKSKSGVVLKPTVKPNITLTANLPVKKKGSVEEVDIKEEDLPVVQGSFHISKTDADITEKKTSLSDNITHRPRITIKTKQPSRSTNANVTRVTSPLYKIASIKKEEKETTTRPTALTTKTTTTLSTTPKRKKTTVYTLATSTRYIADNKTLPPGNPFLFTISPLSLDKEPWIPIQKQSEIALSKHVNNPITFQTSQQDPLIDFLHHKQPVYTSFTNPGLSFHPMNSEALGSTSMIGHPLPVNKIPEITESSFMKNTMSTSLSRTEPTLLTDDNFPTIEDREGENSDIEESSVKNLPNKDSELFVEVETLKHIPGSAGHNVDDTKPSSSSWEFVNGTESKPLIYNSSNEMTDKIYNNTLRAVIIKDHPGANTIKLKQVAVLKNLSSIFHNLASSLGITPHLNASFINQNLTTFTTTATTTVITTTEKSNPYILHHTPYFRSENAEEDISGHGHVEVVDADEESLITETQPSTKLPLVTLIPVKSNSGIRRPLRPRPKRPSNISDMVENRSFPSDPFYKNVNLELTDLSKGPIKFVQTEVVTSVSTEFNKVKINKNRLNDIKILGVLNFELEAPLKETTTLAYEENKTKHELIRNPKMNPKKNFTETELELQDEISLLNLNSTVEKMQNILTEEKLKQLSEISKLNSNRSKTNEETVISNKAISASYIINQSGFKILTKTFNKIPTSTKNEDTKSTYGFGNVGLGTASNKTKCSNFTIRCGDGQCLSDTTRCNQLVDCNDGADEKNCNCVDYLRSQYLLRKICDGVVDCWDFSDENHCEWCKPSQYVCSNSKFCIDKARICDGIRDCPNGDDERQCVTVAPNIRAAGQFPYHSEGYLMIRRHGKWGKLCMQNFEHVITKIRPPWQISDLGKAVCKTMTYKTLFKIKTVNESISINDSYNDRYYELSYTRQNATKSNLVFNESSCKSGETVKMQCKTLECGTRPQAHNQLARRMYRIVGGGNAGLGSWPWQAALYKEGEFQCGGTLISDIWLLSAGHCFYHSLEEHWVARLGALRRGTALPSPYEQLHPIVNIILHPGYVDSGFVNDISLLKMKTSVIFSDFVRPICLPSPGVSLKDGKICTVIGWGQLFEVGRIFPDTLQEVQVPIISTTECRKRTIFLPLYKVTDDMFCAGYERGGRDACLGDSGGPLMCTKANGHWVLQGITSNGYGCARANRPGVYTKVSNYIPWIHSYLHNVKEIPSNKIKASCAGHRCPLGECLPKSRICNGYIECSDGSDEKNCSNT